MRTEYIYYDQLGGREDEEKGKTHIMCFLQLSNTLSGRHTLREGGGITPEPRRKNNSYFYIKKSKNNKFQESLNSIKGGFPKYYGLYVHLSSSFPYLDQDICTYVLFCTGVL